MVHALKKGELKDASPEVKKIAGGISDKDADEFASTKHKGLPEHKKKKKNESYLPTWTEWRQLREDHSSLYGIRESLRNLWASAALQPQNWGFVMDKIYELGKQFPQHQQKLMKAWKAIDMIANKFRAAHQTTRFGGDPRAGAQAQALAEPYYRQADEILTTIRIDPPLH